MRKILLFTFFFSVFITPASLFAQEEFIEPSSRPLTKFSFKQLTGGVILLKARVQNFPDTLNFIFDTGSGGISLDSQTAAYLKLPQVISDRTIRGIAGVRTVNFINNLTLHLPGLSVDSLNFHVNNYDILTSVYGEKIDGIIGYSVLKRYIIKVNFDSSKMEFLTRGTLRYPKGGHLLTPQINALPIQGARVKDEVTVNSRFLYDMGAGLCLMLSKEFVQDSALLRKKRKLYAKEAEGVGGKVDMHVTVIKEFKMGPYRFRNVPTYVFDDVYNVTAYPQLGGIIGNDLLRRFNCILNYDKKEIHITPNSHFADQFDYSYGGLELYFIDGLIVIGDVAEKSPAEKVGLKEGDIVISIGSNFTQNLTQYKLALQNTGEKIKIIVNRNGTLMEFNFKVLNILK